MKGVFYPTPRKRHISPGVRGKAPAGKRKQKARAAPVEREREEEEESDSEASTPEATAVSSRLVAATSSQEPSTSTG